MTKKVETPAPTAAPGTGSALVVYDFGEDAGLGMENVSREEFKIPLMRTLQGLSPQCKPPSAGGIEGARPGMIYNTATGEMWDGDVGVGFIPVFRDHNFPAYIPRSAGGGFVSIYGEDDPLIERLRNEQGKFVKLIHDGTEIVETYYLYGLILTPEESVLHAVVPFVSTQIQKYQSFMTRYQSITYAGPNGKVRPPLWAHKWQLSTKFQTNKKGEFFGWQLRLQQEPPRESLMKLNDDLYIQGRAFYDLLKEGVAKVDHGADAKAGGADADGGPTDPDDEIPF